MAINIPLVTEFVGKGLKDADKALGAFATGAKKTLGGIADFGKNVAIGLGAIGVAGGAAAFKAIQAASDLSEETSKAEVVFGDVADEVDAFARTASRAFGQSRTDALKAANNFAIFGKAAGLTGDDLVGFSTDFVGLASDLASFNNTSPEEAVEAIGAALRGEAEPLRKYGVLLDDATLKAKALEMGIYDGTGALTAQQKIRAAELVIYEQTTAAQGDFARTSDGLANQQRILSAEIANVVAQIGEKLLPFALKLATFFNDTVIPAVQKVADAFSQNGLAGVFEMFSNYLKDKGPQIRDSIVGFLSSAFDWIVGTGLPLLLDVLQKMGNAIVDWVEPRIKPFLIQLGEWIAAGANWFLDVGLPKLVETLVQLGNALVAWIKPQIAPALAALGDLLVSILDWWFTTALPKLAKQLAIVALELVKWIVVITPEVIKGLSVLLTKIVMWFFTDMIPTMVRQGLAVGRGIVNGLGAGIADLGGRLVEFGRTIVNRIVDGIRSVAGNIGSAVLGAIPGAGTIGKAAGFIGNVLPFADGGIVTAPTLGLVGEAGPEAIIPLNQLPGMMAGGGGQPINIYVTSADPQAVIAAIRTYNRTNGPAPITVAA
jgi:hypothetical protein